MILTKSANTLSVINVKNSVFTNNLQSKLKIPTIAEVIDALYDRFNVWISVYFKNNGWLYHIKYIDDDREIFKDEYEDPEYAYLDAIDYVLSEIFSDL
jgi:hypothetical protein